MWGSKLILTILLLTLYDASDRVIFRLKPINQMIDCTSQIKLNNTYPMCPCCRVYTNLYHLHTLAQYYLDGWKLSYYLSPWLYLSKRSTKNGAKIIIQSNKF